jgi:NAD(P)-dependent dehydrogenase (short-subunit alcohol dehydrogenase family)
VAVAAEVDAAVAGTVAEFGSLHVLCNCAGVLVTGSITEVTEQEWDRCFAVNAKGTFLLAHAAVPHLIAADDGVVVNVASVAAITGMPRVAAYTASKGAVVALTRSMAIDLAPHGVRVNAICPGTVLTPMTEPMARWRGGGDFAAGLDYMTAKVPLGRLGTPEEIANVAAFLASADASFITGAVITADGGMSA